MLLLREPVPAHAPDAARDARGAGRRRAGAGGVITHTKLAVYNCITRTTRSEALVVRGTGYGVDAQVLAVREEPRIAEQQFGNFQDFGEMRASKVSAITCNP